MQKERNMKPAVNCLLIWFSSLMCPLVATYRNDPGIDSHPLKTFWCKNSQTDRQRPWSSVFFCPDAADWVIISDQYLKDGQDATVPDVALIRVILCITQTSEDLKSFTDTNPASLWAEHLSRRWRTHIITTVLHELSVVTNLTHLDHGRLYRAVRKPRPVHHPCCQVRHALHHKGVKGHQSKLLLQ